MGSHCSAAAECDGQCVASGDFPEGICTRACDENADCPAGWSCISSSGGVCLENCSSASECEQKYGERWTCDAESLEEGDATANVCVGD